MRIAIPRGSAHRAGLARGVLLAPRALRVRRVLRRSRGPKAEEATKDRAARPQAGGGGGARRLRACGGASMLRM